MKTDKYSKLIEKINKIVYSEFGVHIMNEEQFHKLKELLISKEQKIREEAQLDILNDLIQEYKPNNSWFMAVEKIRTQLSKQER